MSACDVSEEVEAEAEAEEELPAAEGVKPFVKSLGGKTQLLPVLREWMPKRVAVYSEPFVGGGALFFDTRPRHAYLADTNPSLVTAYNVVRDYVEALIASLNTYAGAYESFMANGTAEKFYYHVRSVDPETLDKVDRAAWMIFLNKTSFNGLWRVNAAGKFNVPFGKRAKPNICDETTLRACSEVLQRATITHRDFRETNPPAGSVVYFDSPYEPLNKTSDFTTYTAGGFSAQDQKDLRDLARKLKQRGVYVILSNSSAPLIRELYADGFEIREVPERRSINSDGASRGAVTELLIR